MKDKIDDMSEQWQESETCEEWMDKIQDIDDCANELACVITNLKDILT